MATYTAGSDLLPFRRVKLLAGSTESPYEVVYAGAGELCIGVTGPNAVVYGEMVEVVPIGQVEAFFVEATVVIAYGEALYGDIDGLVTNLPQGVAQLVAVGTNTEEDPAVPATFRHSDEFYSDVSPNPRVEITKTEIAGYSDATTKEFSLNAATGKALAGAGAVKLGANGIDIETSTSYEAARAIDFKTALGALVASIFAQQPLNADNNVLSLQASVCDFICQALLGATVSPGGLAVTLIGAGVVGDDYPPSLAVSSDDSGASRQNLLTAFGIHRADYSDSDGTVSEFRKSISLADDAYLDLPAGLGGGFGVAMIGDAQEYAQFVFSSAGAVTLIAQSANSAASDTDGKLCVFGSSGVVRVKNRLGSELVALIGATFK